MHKALHRVARVPSLSSLRRHVSHSPASPHFFLHKPTTTVGSLSATTSHARPAGRTNPTAAMLPTDSTALAAPDANTSTPTRRSSWKAHSDMYTPVPTSEKPAAPQTLPFHDAPDSPSPITAASSDLESQATHPYKPKPKRGKLAICALVFLTLALLVFGALLLMHTWFPDVLGITELKGEMMDADKAISMLKSQVGGLYRYMEGLDVMKGWTGAPGANGTEGLGLGGVGGNETVVL
jgi:hypothetical protein